MTTIESLSFYVSPKEVAELLGVNVRTVERMTARGELTVYKPSKKIARYKLPEVIEWMDRQAVAV